MKKALQLTHCAVTLGAVLTIEAQVQTHETQRINEGKLKKYQFHFVKNREVPDINDKLYFGFGIANFS